MKTTDDLIHTLSDTLTPATRIASPFTLFLGWCIFVSSYIILMLMLSGIRSDLPVKLGSTPFIIEVGLLAAIILTSGLSAILLSFPDLFQKQWMVATPLISFMLFLATLVILWRNDIPTPPPPHSLMCSLSIALFSLPPAFALFYILRHHAPTHIMFSGATALLATVSIGCLILRLSEKTDSMDHLLLWHYLPMILFTVAGLFLGKKYLHW